jgi:hypothetical protein
VPLLAHHNLVWPSVKFLTTPLTVNWGKIARSRLGFCTPGFESGISRSPHPAPTFLILLTFPAAIRSYFCCYCSLFAVNNFYFQLMCRHVCFYAFHMMLVLDDSCCSNNFVVVIQRYLGLLFASVVNLCCLLQLSITVCFLWPLFFCLLMFISDCYCFCDVYQCCCSVAVIFCCWCLIVDI